MIEIVKCEQCKYWKYIGHDPILNTKFGICRCYQWVSTGDEACPETDDKDFCSFGKRDKEDE